MPRHTFSPAFSAGVDTLISRRAPYARRHAFIDADAPLLLLLKRFCRARRHEWRRARFSCQIRRFCARWSA